MRYPAISLLLTVLAMGCATEGFDLATLPAPNALSTEEEVQYGQQMAVQVDQQTKRLNDPALQAYVQQIGQRLAAQAPRQDVPYQFTVLDDPKEVNAFALPGGHLYVYTGLMRLCSNEAELAGVMAHEIAHVAAHHHGEMLARQKQAAAAQGLLLGQNPGAIAQIVAQAIGKGVMAQFSQADEAEADRMAMDIMFKSAYNPTAIVTFMNKMMQYEQQQGGGGSGILARFFASHPPTPERMARLQSLLAQYPPQTVAQLGTFQQRYQQNALSKIGR